MARGKESKSEGKKNLHLIQLGVRQRRTSYEVVFFLSPGLLSFLRAMYQGFLFLFFLLKMITQKNTQMKHPEKLHTPPPLAKIMATSWAIQSETRVTRSRALCYAWGIFLNENVMLYRLAVKHGTRQKPQASTNNLTLFL
ncbi:hypothetical protein [Chitinophaga silvisoli]|nr:hypothetical protein [Chitinophaga silvisoli]